MSGLLASPRALREAFDCALLDLDGVVYRGPQAVPHAAAAVGEARALGMGTMFVTNNASRTPDAVADHLTDLGIPTGPEEVMTAAMAVAALVADEADSTTRVLVVGGRGLRRALADEGLHIVESADEAPTVVVQGFDPALTWSDLAEAAYAIARGAEHVASNMDQSLPTERGFAPGNGALVAAVVAATGRPARSSGKPAPQIFHQAAQSCHARTPLVIGDRLDTDLAGARAAQYPGLWVNTGVDGPTEVVRALPAQRPAFLGADLRCLADPHPAPQQHGEWWVCEAAAARVHRDALIVRRAGQEVDIDADTELSLDELRAAAAAAWAAADALGVDTVLGTDFPQIGLADPEREHLAR